ncbi:ribonuclease-like protein T2 [Xylaria sp. CBS 124048]|nr:ribonuclease-like protein T2 [Xylaria sp. CBS 124048]
MASVLLPMALAALPAAKAAVVSNVFAATCSSSVQSCSSAADSSSVSSCCVNKPGGQFLQPQFWDTDPVTGPSNSWTIHGLWPDNCDGTFSNGCDSSREYTDITSILDNNGKSSLVSFMQEFWQSNDESPEDFWEHEWATHGTCVSTLDPSCYSNYQTGEEAADYFQVVVDLFKTLDTFGALSAAGITPSNSQTYTSSEIQDALEKVTGKAAVITCEGSSLSEIYYGFFANGPLQNGDFVPSTIVGMDSNCPNSGIKYVPKSGASPAPTTTSRGGSSPTTTTRGGGSPPTATATGTFSGKGFLNAIFNGEQDGCLISAGKWFTSGTCATYTATPSGSGFTLKSSKGTCGITGDTFSCGSGISATIFNADGNNLALDGSSTFFAASAPTGQDQASVFTEDRSGDVPVTFQWESM